MNNRGFTLVEVLATVTIMVLIMLIAVPTSIKFIERGKNQQYDILEDQIISAASKYYIKHKDTTCIELSVLINDIDEKYVDGVDVIDPRSNTILTTNKVQVNIDGSKVTYGLVVTCS